MESLIGIMHAGIGRLPGQKFLRALGAIGSRRIMGVLGFLVPKGVDERVFSRHILSFC
jgi:hypothetical protein